MSQSRKVYLEAIRGMAILFVIFNHTDGFIYYTVTENPFTWLYSAIFAVLCRTAVPLFFMVSGVLLLEKEESLKTLFCKRVLRIAVVLIVVSLLYYLFDIARNRIAEPGIIDFLKAVLGKGVRDSFWFLKTYLIYLLSLPFLRKIACGMGRTLVIYLAVLKGIGELAMPVLGRICDMPLSFDIGIAGDCIYYSLMGYCLTHTEEAVGESISGGKLLAVVTALIILGVGLVWILGNDTDVYGRNTDLLIFLLAPALFLLVKHWTKNLTGESILSRLVILAGSCAFGIYLLDNFVRWQYLALYLHLCQSMPGAAACSIYVLLVFVTGGIYTWMLKRIPLLRKLL